MYAMEYTKQERAAPAVITIVVHLALIYVFAAGMGVVPSPPRLREIILVDTPEKVEPPTVPYDPEPGSKANNFQLPKLGPEPELEIEQNYYPPTGSTEPPIVTGGGGGVVIEEAVTGVRVVSSPEPAYPLISRARNEEGTVLVKVMISPYGLAGDVQVEKSSGYPRLDEAAIKAVKGWRFAPAKRGSQAIATWVTVPVKFVLNARG